MVKSKTTSKPRKQNKKAILVNFILDGSGSMVSIADEAVQGYNGYIEKLRKDKDNEYFVSFTVFDTRVDQRHVVVPLAEVKPLDRSNYPMMGATALLDAQGRTITEAEKVLASNPKIGSVLNITMTDGFENSSREFTNATVKELIERLDKTGNWTFVYLGANQDAFATSAAMGYKTGNVSNYQTQNAHLVFANLASATAVRGQSAGMGIASSEAFFKDAGLSSAEGENENPFSSNSTNTK